MHLTPLQTKQKDWVIAWQDRRDYSARDALLDSVKGLLIKAARRADRACPGAFEDALSSYQLALLESFDKTDREKMNGFASWCTDRFREPYKRIFLDENSPASGSPKRMRPSRRVPITSDFDDEGGFALANPEPEKTVDPGFNQALTNAGIDPRNLEILLSSYQHKAKKKGSCRKVGMVFGISTTRVQQIEADALKKLQERFRELGLSIDDFF